MILWFALLAAFFLVGCEEEPDWKKTRPAGKYEPVVIVQERFPEGCPFNALGCYVQEDLASATPAKIYIKPRLPEWEYWCVHRHEMKHHAGWTHPEGFSDCG